MYVLYHPKLIIRTRKKHSEAPSSSIIVLTQNKEEEMNSQAPPLCVRGCGFFGSVENINLCSKCYRQYLRQEEEEEEEEEFTPPPLTATATSAAAARDAAAAAEKKKKKKRCKKCNKKVGLLGFQCRCKDTFCGAHRYPEEHRCTVDLVATARELLVSQNPAVKTDKLEERV